LNKKIIKDSRRKMISEAVVIILLLSGMFLSSNIQAEYLDVEENSLTLSYSSVKNDNETWYAYNAYDEGGMSGGPVSFPSDNPGDVTLIAPTSSYEFIAGACFVNDIWYGCEIYSPPDYPDDKIWTIDKITGDMTEVGNYGVTDGLNGLAYDDSIDTLYGCSAEDLYTIDQNDGSATLVGSMGVGELFIGIACDGEGTIYGINLNDESLYSINPISGSATLIGSTGLSLNYAQDMAYDKDNNKLYLSAFIYPKKDVDSNGLCPDGLKYFGGLYECNTTDGSTILIGNFGITEVTGFAIPYTTWSEWNATILATPAATGSTDFVTLGEAADATDGPPHDSYDIIDVPPSTPPFVNVWFDDGMDAPYDNLSIDFRHGPDTKKVWNLTVFWNDTNSTTITLSWNPNEFLDSEYGSIQLYEKDTKSYVTNMFGDNDYTFPVDAYVTYEFEIRCMLNPENINIATFTNNWNFISLPLNQSVEKNDLIIRYDGTNYSWDEAIDPMNLFIDPVIFSWNRNSQTYNYMIGDSIVLEPGYGYWIYAYENCELWVQNTIMISYDNYITDLKNNWNGIGIPNDESTTLGNLEIIHESITYNWSEATDPGILIIDPVVFWWNSSLQSYQYLIDPESVLEPGWGYWMFVYYDCVLRVV